MRENMIMSVRKERISILGRHMLYLFWDMFTLYRRLLIHLIRVPAQFYFSLIQPFIWFLLFGELFSRVTTGFGLLQETKTGTVVEQFGTTNYLAFLLPAVIVQVVLFGASGSALSIINDDITGYL